MSAIILNSIILETPSLYSLQWEKLFLRAISIFQNKKNFEAMHQNNLLTYGRHCYSKIIRLMMEQSFPHRKTQS